jgi:glycosyltransferase involved in cell wall biosynthesis
MRVIQTSKAYYPLIGGVETVIANLSEGMLAKEIDVRVLVCNSIPSLWKSQSEVNGVPVTYVPMLVKVASLPLSPTYPLHLAQMRADILHVHQPFPLADIALMASPQTRKNFSRIVVTWHGDIVRQKLFMKFYEPLLNRFLQIVDRIFVGSPNHISSSPFLQSYAEKCEVIPLGVKLDWVVKSETRLQRVNSIRKEFGSPLLLFVGRLVYYKGLKYLVESMRMAPQARLLIIGSGPLYSNLMKQIVLLKLESRVKIIPHVSETDLHAFYEACDIFVLPSSEPAEAFGLVQVEAMACGKPVVSTDLKTGVTFVNQHEVTGLTVPVRDSGALADALRRLINSQKLREQLGKNAKKRAFEEFTADKMVERTIKSYKSLLTQ